MISCWTVYCLNHDFIPCICIYGWIIIHIYIILLLYIIILYYSIIIYSIQLASACATGIKPCRVVAALSLEPARPARIRRAVASEARPAVASEARPTWDEASGSEPSVVDGSGNKCNNCRGWRLHSWYIVGMLLYSRQWEIPSLGSTENETRFLCMKSSAVSVVDCWDCDHRDPFCCLWSRPLAVYSAISRLQRAALPQHGLHALCTVIRSDVIPVPEASTG